MIEKIIDYTEVTGEQLELIFEYFSDLGLLNEEGKKKRHECRDKYTKE